jgi:hypothetical protein
MSNLRRKQVEEVLDEDRRVNRRVFDKEKEQAKVFNETLKPKSDRDLDTEVNVDRSVEKLMSILEKKLQALEYLFKFDAKDARYKEGFSEFMATGGVVIAYNDLARLANKPELANATREAVKTKITQIQATIDALVYGANELIPKWSGRGVSDQDFSIRIVPLIGALNVYRTIQRQLFRGSIQPISYTELENNVKEIKASLPSRMRNRLAGVERTADLKTRPILVKAKEDALERRRRMLESERGRPLSADELINLRNTIFGVRENPFIDPALEAELNRQAQVSADAKKMAGEMLPAPEMAERPAELYREVNPEYKAGIAKALEDRAESMYRSLKDKLEKSLDKYAPDEDGDYEAVDEDDVVDDRDSLAQALIDAIVKSKELQGEEADADEIEEDIIDRYASLYDENPRDDDARFYKLLTKMAQELLQTQQFVFNKEKEAEYKKAVDRLAPVGLGSGTARSKAGKMGLEYDDRRNDPYFVF